MNATEDVMNKVEVNREKVLSLGTEITSIYSFSYISCNRYYRFLLCNKYYNLEIKWILKIDLILMLEVILRLEISLNIERMVLLLWNPFNYVKRMEQLYDYFTR